MKKLLILLLLFPLAASARMFPREFPVNAVCWDNFEEAIQYHQDILGEYPVGKGWIGEKVPHLQLSCTILQNLLGHS